MNDFMKLSEAITRMKEQKKTHGDVEVYFDCPKRKKCSAIDTIIFSFVSMTTHMTEKGKGK